MRSGSSCKATVAIKGDAGSLELSRSGTGSCPGAFHLSFASVFLVFLEGIDRRVENLSNARTVTTSIIIVVMQRQGFD